MTFQEFLDADLDRLRRYARLLTGDRDAAHDVLADVLIKAQLGWHRIGRMDHPAAYVRSMVTNAHVSDKRWWSSRFMSATRTGELPEGAGTAPQHAVDDRAQLDQLLSRLPHQQRAAIVLRYYLDLSDQEIATELRCTTGAVRTYVSRGLTAKWQVAWTRWGPATIRVYPPAKVALTSGDLAALAASVRLAPTLGVLDQPNPIVESSLAQRLRDEAATATG